MRWTTNRCARAVLLGTVTALLAGGAAGAALAVDDTEPPVLHTPRSAEFVRQSQVTEWRLGQEVFTENILARVRWSAADEVSGICDMTVERVGAGYAPYAVLTGAPAVGSYTDVESDYDDQFGGGSLKLVGWNVIATDCAGNTTTNYVRGAPVATQENNDTAGYQGVTISYRGEWSRDGCADCIGDAASVTSDRGAVATIRANPGARVALVLRRGPEHGVADIYVDGRRRGSVSTYSREPTERTILWTRQLRRHETTIEIVNRGLRHRSSLLGVDAVLTRG